MVGLAYHNVLYDTSRGGGVKKPVLDSKRNVNGELCTPHFGGPSACSNFGFLITITRSLS